MPNNTNSDLFREVAGGAIIVLMCFVVIASIVLQATSHVFNIHPALLTALCSSFTSIVWWYYRRDPEAKKLEAALDDNAKLAKQNEDLRITLGGLLKLDDSSKEEIKKLRDQSLDLLAEPTD
jgi:hypothetical protein